MLRNRGRVVAFIGRTYVSMESKTPEDEYLDYFMEMALDPEDRKAPEAWDAEEEYLSMFIAHAQDPVPTESKKDGAESAVTTASLDIRFSKFINTYSNSRLRRDSGVGLIRISLAVVPLSGFTVYAEDSTLLCYTMSGEGEVILNGVGTPQRKYDCAWIDCSKHIQFRSYPGKPWECAFVRVHGEKNPWTLSSVSVQLYQKGAVFMTFGAGTRFRSIIWELLSPKTDQHPDSENIYNHLLMGLFNELTLAFMCNRTRQVVIPDVIAAIQAYLDNNYFEDICLDGLSKRFGISKFHMSREFKRYIGKSPNDYLIDRRLDRAKELLANSNRTVAEIGQLVGIPNANHFLYLFKNREGLTPTAFRKRRI